MDTGFKLVQLVFMNTMIVVANAILAKLYGLDTEPAFKSHRYLGALRHLDNTSKIVPDEVEKVKREIQI
jgi:hypothetical protein